VGNEREEKGIPRKESGRYRTRRAAEYSEGREGQGETHSEMVDEHKQRSPVEVVAQREERGEKQGF
jgi:hypothetical protein